MKDTKRARITRELKELILSRRSGVSRSEVSGLLNIDLRTAATYLEELVSAGLLRCEISVGSGKGRPRMLYRSNADKLAFLGIQIAGNMSAASTLVDSVGRKLGSRQYALPENGSRLSTFAAVLEIIEDFRHFQDYSLYGAGLAISRWLQPPLAGEDVYANLADYLARESQVCIHRDVNINSVAFAIARSMNCRNLAVIHLGRVLEFGLVLDGMPDADFARREAWLAHLCVNPDGSRCYCGKYGCLENYVSSCARDERSKKGSNPALWRTLGKMLGVAMVRVARKYPVEKIVLLGAGELFPAAEEYFAQRMPVHCSLNTVHTPADVHYGEALEALHFELYRYTEKSQ